MFDGAIQYNKGFNGEPLLSLWPWPSFCTAFWLFLLSSLFKLLLFLHVLPALQLPSLPFAVRAFPASSFSCVVLQ